MPTPVSEEYLGDGYMITLKANSHIEPTDVVHLDPHVYASLLRFVGRITAEQEKQNASESS